MPPSRPLRRIFAVTSGITAIFLATLVGLFFFYDDRTLTFFDSPSGKWRFVVAEGCLGHACAHSAYLEQRSLFWSSRRECIFSLHGDSIAFEQGSVSWNADETALDWYTPTFNVEGHIDFALDCAPR